MQNSPEKVCSGRPKRRPCNEDSLGPEAVDQIGKRLVFADLGVDQLRHCQENVCLGGSSDQGLHTCHLAIDQASQTFYTTITQTTGYT